MGVTTTAEGPTSNTESFTLMALTFQRRWHRHHRHKKTSPPLRALSACKTVLWTSARLHQNAPSTLLRFVSAHLDGDRAEPDTGSSGAGSAVCWPESFSGSGG